MEKISRNNIKDMVLAAVFLALGMILPLFTSQIKEIGDTLLPMHFAVLLCGLVCGWKYGLAVGFALPFLRSVIFGMPPLYPNAIWMSLEIATYGLVSGLVYSRLPGNKIRSIYISLICGMITGRIVWGLAKTVLLGLADKPFTFGMFVAQGITDAAPGIVIQLLVIPIIVKILQKQGGEK